MKKKIKDLTSAEIDKVCKCYGGIYCSDRCPLYRISSRGKRVCNLIHNNYKLSQKEKERLEQEIEVPQCTLI